MAYTDRPVEALIFFNYPIQSNPLIPSGLSDSCNKFYVQLNADTSLAQCLAPLKQATSGAYGISSLNTVCSASTCDATTIGAQLSLFQQACQTELTSSKIAQVIITYDSLYLLNILPKVVCLKDTSGNYCLANSTTSSSKRASLDRRGSQQVFIPDATKFNQGNIAFLGLKTDEDADKLCTPCTRQIMGAYTNQLSSTPYGPGMSNSQLFPSEPALYSAINSKCGASFLGGQVQAAGGLATGAAPRSADGSFAFVGSAIAAAAAGAVALL